MSLNTVDTVLETEKRTDEKVAAAQESAHKRLMMVSRKHRHEPMR